MGFRRRGCHRYCCCMLSPSLFHQDGNPGNHNHGCLPRGDLIVGSVDFIVIVIVIFILRSFVPQKGEELTYKWEEKKFIHPWASPMIFSRGL